MDHFEPGTPFRLTGSQLSPDISGGPGSAKSDDAQRRLFVAMAARRQLHGTLLSLDRIVEADLLEANKYEADLARLVGRLSVDGWPELARPTLDSFISTLEAYGARGWFVPWAIENHVEGEVMSRRPRWLDRLQLIARGLRLVFVDAAPPEAVAAELEVPWPMELPWPPEPVESERRRTAPRSNAGIRPFATRGA